MELGGGGSVSLRIGLSQSMTESNEEDVNQVILSVFLEVLEGQRRIKRNQETDDFPSSTMFQCNYFSPILV